MSWDYAVSYCGFAARGAEGLCPSEENNHILGLRPNRNAVYGHSPKKEEGSDAKGQALPHIS
jgi:hypothetical protein